MKDDVFFLGFFTGMVFLGLCFLETTKRKPARPIVGGEKIITIKFGR